MLQLDNSRYLYNVRTCVCVYSQLSSSCTDNDKEPTYDFIYKGLPMCLFVLCIVPGLGHSTLWLVLVCSSRHTCIAVSIVIHTILPTPPYFKSTDPPQIVSNCSSLLL